MTDRPSYPGLPRWVKVSGIILIVLIQLITVIFAFAIGGEYGPDQFGPGQHGPSNEASSETTFMRESMEKEIIPDGLS